MWGTLAELIENLKGMVDTEFFQKVAPHLESILRNTPSSIRFNIDEHSEQQDAQLKRLFSRLSCYGDRIYIAVHEKWRNKVSVDSSVFNLVLER